MPQTTLKKSDGSGAGSVALSEKLFGANINKGLSRTSKRAQGVLARV
jgi:hypothetical protein